MQRLADGNATQAGGLEHGDNVVSVRRMHLEHRAELFVEERRNRRAGQFVERDGEPAAACERHLGEGDEQSAVGTVVVREQPALRMQRLDCRKKSFQ